MNKTQKITKPGYPIAIRTKRDVFILGRGGCCGLRFCFDQGFNPGYIVFTEIEGGIISIWISAFSITGIKFIERKD